MDWFIFIVLIASTETTNHMYIDKRNLERQKKYDEKKRKKEKKLKSQEDVGSLTNSYYEPTYYPQKTRNYQARYDARRETKDSNYDKRREAKNSNTKFWLGLALGYVFFK